MTQHSRRVLAPLRRHITNLASRQNAMLLVCLLALAAPVFAQGGGTSPWENAVDVLKLAFTGNIAKGLSLVSIVVGGLMFAFGEGQSKKMLSGIVFGVGMAIQAANFMTWMFG